jgi:hypothetical protein
MFAAWTERESAAFVADKCGVHHRTVERYRVADHWDARLAEIRSNARSKADYGIAEAMAESLRIVRMYKSRLAEAIERKHLTDDDVSVADLERVVRLEAFVLGAAESRHAVITEFSHWSDEDLERYATTGAVPGEGAGTEGPSVERETSPCEGG